MNLKAKAVITGLALAIGLNFPVLAANYYLIAFNLDQTTPSLLNRAIAQTQKPTDTMSNPNHTADSMKKPTGNAMKKTTGDTMTKPKG